MNAVKPEAQPGQLTQPRRLHGGARHVGLSGAVDDGDTERRQQQRDHGERVVRDGFPDHSPVTFTCVMVAFR
jgi:hypothetical protein